MLEKLGELGIDYRSLIIYLINFALLLALLYFGGYKLILKMLDERAARIKESMEQAERLNEQSTRAQEEIKSQMETARREGQGIVAQATQISERLKDEARQEARQEAKTIIARARIEIDREREEAIRKLRQEFVDIAILAAEKVINQSLDKNTQEKIIHQVLQESTWSKS